MEDRQQYTEEEIRERLNQCGLKATPQRVRVYEAMCTLGHASADAVFQHLGAGQGKMTLATVYNVLESMTQAGLLMRRPSFSSKMYFDVHTDAHCHIYQQDTSEISDYRDEALQRSVEERIRAQLPAGLALDRVEIQILCHSQSHET